MPNILGLKRVEIWPKTGVIEISSAGINRRYTIVDLAKIKEREAVEWVDKHGNIDILFEDACRRYRDANGDCDENTIAQAGISKEKIRRNMIAIHAERLAKEYADEFAHDVEKILMKHLAIKG